MYTVIKTENLCKFYFPRRPHEIRALKDMNLEIRKNQWVLFNGPSGSGKTTLISLIGGIDRPTSGRVHLYGEELTALSDVALARIRQKTIGFVFQNFNLLPRVPAWENVTYPLIPMGWSERQRREKALRILDQLHLGDRIDHPPEQLSGGEQQRVAIARALVNDPEIIIADEPTSNIDARSVTTLLDILATLKDNGKTIIVASHGSIFFEFADVIFDLEEGGLVKTRPGDKGFKA